MLQEGSDADLSFLSTDYRYIVDHADAIEAEFKSSPRHLEFLKGIVTDLFLDLHKLKGKNGQAKVPELIRLLETDYSFDALMAAFAPNRF